MKKRLITGVCYVIVMVALLVMKLLIPTTADGMDYGALGVDVLFWIISVVGAYEFTRALGERKKLVEGEELTGQAAITGGISKAQRIAVIVTCALLIPVFVISKMVAIKLCPDEEVYLPGGVALVMLLAVSCLGALITASLTIFDHERSDLKSTAYAELVILYCGILACVAPNINHMADNSEAAILLLFVIVPFVDTGAFLFGKLFGKLMPLKLAPKTSPNKTVIGGVGGILGGLVAAVLVWAICQYTSAVGFAHRGSVHSVIVLMIIALPTAILAQLGDLFESAIKRCCGIKDMGKILPGHGGVLDRFDSMLFASVSIVVCFMAL